MSLTLIDPVTTYVPALNVTVPLVALMPLSTPGERVVASPLFAGSRVVFQSSGGVGNSVPRGSAKGAVSVTGLGRHACVHAGFSSAILAVGPTALTAPDPVILPFPSISPVTTTALSVDSTVSSASGLVPKPSKQSSQSCPGGTPALLTPQLLALGRLWASTSPDANIRVPPRTVPQP